MAYIAKIKDTAGTTGVIASALYGTCSTAASTAEKAVTCADFDTAMANCPTGLTIYVKFTNSNTAATPTLNVNSKGAKNIYKYGTTKPGTTANTSWQAGSVVSFTYDGSYWQMNNHLDDTTYSSLAAASGGTAVSLVTTGEKYSWNAKSGSDINVEQTATDTASSNTYYPILFGASNTTTTTTEGARKTQYLTYDPRDKILQLSSGGYDTTDGGAQCGIQSSTIVLKYRKKDANNTRTHNHVAGLYPDLLNGGATLLLQNEYNSVSYTMKAYAHDIVLSGTYNSASNTWDGTNTSLKTAIGSARDVVKQTATTTNATYELLFSGSANNTTSTEGTRKTNTLTYNPSTKALTTYGGEIALKWDSTVTPTMLKLYQVDGTTVTGQIGCDSVEYTTTETLTAVGTTIDTTYQSRFESDEISCKISNDISTGGTVYSYYSNLRIVTNRDISSSLATGKPYCDIVLTSNYSGGNATWDGTNTSLRTALTDKLSKTGGTMTGGSQSWINVGKDPLIHVSKPSSTSAMSWIGGDTKNGRIVIATFPSTDDRIYFNYYTNTTLSGSTNKYDQSMKWDGATNKLWFVKNGGGVVCQSEDGNYTCSLQVGSSGQARGLYDDTKSRWIIYSDSNGIIKTGATLVPPAITFSADAAISFQAESSAENTGELAWWYYNGQEKCRIWCDGSFTSGLGPQYRCYKSGGGSALYSGRLALVSSSDIRLKKNVSDTEVVDALNIVNQIKMRSFDWKNTDEHQTIGFIADELELLDPNFVDKGSGGLDSFGEINPKSINNFYLLGYVVKSLQELSEICQTQQKEIDSLKSKLG